MAKRRTLDSPAAISTLLASEVMPHCGRNNFFSPEKRNMKSSSFHPK